MKRLFINVGLPKCGTCTLHDAAVRSGLTACHQRSGDTWIAPLMFKAHRDGDDPLKYIACEVITQPDMAVAGVSLWPQMDTGLLNAIRRHHPEIWFVHNTRDPDDHAASMLRWGGWAEKMADMDVPGLAKPINHANLRDWIVRHNWFTYDHFSDDDRYVEVDFDDNPRETLEAALGITFAWWGVSNASSERAHVEVE